MKKIFALVLALVLALSLAACGGNTEPVVEDETQPVGEPAAEIVTLNPGVLTIGAEIGYPPFEYYASDGVTPMGLDIDIANAVAAKLGLEVQFINTSFDTIFAGIGSNYDCVISAVTINDERLEQMDFSDPYVKNYQTVVLRADSELEITGFESLEGLSVGVQAGTTSEDYMKDFIATGSVNATLVPNEQVLMSFTQLANGEIDAVLCDSSVAINYVANDAESYKIAWTQDTDAEEFGIAVAKGDAALQSALNKALAELEEEGVLDELRATWLN